MLIRKLKDQKEIIAGDACYLRELLNARKDKRAYRYSLAHAVVKPGQKTTPHKLKTSEVYYILEGKGRMHIGKEFREVGPGDCIDIPPRAIQWIENIGSKKLALICIVDPSWCPEDEIVLKNRRN